MKDIDLAPIHDDPEHEPPQFYIPVIPLVLANGSKGIATGFATNILPRDMKDIKKACESYLKKGKIAKRLTVSFPEFNGVTRYDVATDRFLCTGVYNKPSGTRLTITEIPYGYDRESYVKILDKLESEGDIVSYDDIGGKAGFKFEIKLKQQTSAKWSHDKIIKNFKLEKSHAENLTVIDHNSKLREYKDERDLIVDFCDYRLTVLDKRIVARVAEFTELDRWLKIKAEFITGVLNDNITFKGKKKDAIVKQIVSLITSATEEDAERLLRMNIMTLTKEQVDQLKLDIKANKETLTFWKTTTPSDQFIFDLSEI